MYSCNNNNNNNNDNNNNDNNDNNNNNNIIIIMDRKTRRLLTMYRSMHSQGDVDRTYLKRKKGGRGLISVEECVMLAKTSLGF